MLCFSSVEPYSRIAGLAFMVTAGLAASQVEHAQERSLHRPSAPQRAAFLLAAFTALGLIAFFMPPEDRARIVRHIVIFFARLVTH
jgi:hypothetical protein